MTIEEFDNTSFGGIMMCRYKLQEYPIISVDFEEKLIAINETSELFSDILDWKRCENITLIK